MTDEPLKPDFDALERRSQYILNFRPAQCIGGPLDGQSVNMPRDAAFYEVQLPSGKMFRYRLQSEVLLPAMTKRLVLVPDEE